MNGLEPDFYRTPRLRLQAVIDLIGFKERP